MNKNEMIKLHKYFVDMIEMVEEIDKDGFDNAKIKKALLDILEDEEYELFLKINPFIKREGKKREA